MRIGLPRRVAPAAPPVPVGYTISLTVPAYLVERTDLLAPALFLALLALAAWLLYHPRVPRVCVKLEEDERVNVLPPSNGAPSKPSNTELPCHDPATVLPRPRT
jgi:hypothetical protein